MVKDVPVPFIKRNGKILYHITALRCGSCAHLRKPTEKEKKEGLILVCDAKSWGTMKQFTANCMFQDELFASKCEDYKKGKRVETFIFR